MQGVKGKSSKYINDHSLAPHRFEWQEGYGVFSYGQSQIDSVYKYIQEQEEHHKKQTFREEYLEFLQKFKVEYDEQYVFKELIYIWAVPTALVLWVGHFQRVETRCYNIGRADGSLISEMYSLNL